MTYSETETDLDSTIPITNLDTEKYLDSTQITTTKYSTDNVSVKEKKCLEDQCILINSNLINIYFKWDYNYVPLEIFYLDLWLEGLDEKNNLIERVYFGGLFDFNGSVKLSLNITPGYPYINTTEIISINLNKIQYNIKSLAIIINSTNSKDILNARNAYISIYEMSSTKILLTEILLKKKLINQYWLNNTKSGILFFYGIIERKEDNKWIFRKMYESFENRDLAYYQIFLEQYKNQKYYCYGENGLSNGTIIDLYS